eukprot:6329811-Pyramimonas_sp.AAC.1
MPRGADTQGIFVQVKDCASVNPRVPLGVSSNIGLAPTHLPLASQAQHLDGRALQAGPQDR